MLKDNIINNINLEELPKDVINAIYEEIAKLSTPHKLIIYSKLFHGSLFKIDKKVDLFKINNLSSAKIYNNFINNVKINLLGDKNEN